MNEKDTLNERDSLLIADHELLYNTIMNSKNYVRNCYDEETTREFFDCIKFVVRFLSFFIEHDLLCSFEEIVCMKKSAAFVMNSRNISFADLKINSKIARDLIVRRRITCSVLDEQIFRAEVESSKESPQYLSANERIYYYPIFRNQITGRNITFAYRNENFTSIYDLRAFL